ncbi:MAG TPA: hypothetical protein PLK50_02430 [Ottowia sp.]|uniref:rolling circle replication-associated protein n=1 Tax=Ottowia sp. TaxID=1898956 RepID=UPI002B5C424E|nr:hypothetical protein [Ottowia sp.]HPZ56156.1 hypothetical protein [Ottowia sp.]
MYTYTSAEKQALRYRQELIAFGQRIAATHFVTLNTNRDFTLEVAQRLLKLWTIEVERQVCGKNYKKRPSEERIEFLGVPEFTLAGCPHFHLYVKVPAAKWDKYERIATKRWDAIVNSGSIDVQRLSDDARSPERVLGYMTKRVSQNASLPFVHSALYA